MANGSDDDDYLSDKFLVNAAEAQKSRTYSEKRKEALYKSRLRNEQNKTKSRRQLELDSREEGLSKSLFERAEDDKVSGSGSENKALSMMKKMGFKPGQALGATARTDEGSTNLPPSTSPTPEPTRAPQRDISSVQEKYTTQSERHLVNPLPLNEWSGTFPAVFSFNELCFPLLPLFLTLPCITKSPLLIYRQEGHRSWQARPFTHGTRAPRQGGESCGRDGEGVFQRPDTSRV